MAWEAAAGEIGIRGRFLRKPAAFFWAKGTGKSAWRAGFFIAPGTFIILAARKRRKPPRFSKKMNG